MIRHVSALLLLFAVPALSLAPEPSPPQAGPVAIIKSSEIRPGMKGTAWTVFQGNVPEPVPVEVIGLLKNAWGPRQDIIIAKLGGKVERTNVAGGMSGSPVYIDGKLAGAIALRLSVFSPDAICGITPIELMLEVNDFDFSVPEDAKTPDQALNRRTVEVPGELLAQAVAAGASASPARRSQIMVPIETPLTFSGFHQGVLNEFGPMFEQLGVSAVQGGASGSLRDSAPEQGWRNSLRPGDAVTGVLVSGDMAITGLGTVTYNDGRRVLAFGHPFFNLGPVNMPMGKGEVLMVLSSAFQPNKFANAAGIVGALRQDRHSAIMGVLGEQAPTIPVSLKVRTFDRQLATRKEKDFRFNVFVQQKWTPYLMMVTLFNSISGLNEFADEVTYRLSGQVELDGHQQLSLATMQTAGELPVPAPMLLAGWWGDKFNRLFLNAVKTPRLRRVNATIDLLPERRVATIESAWAAAEETDPGADVPVKVFLQPYRGERIQRDFTVRIPAWLPQGTHRILLSDSDTLNRMQNTAAMASRFMDLPETVSLINQERSNDRLYISIAQSRPTLYYEDKSLPSLPASVANVMQAGRNGSRRFVTWGESVQEQMSLPFDLVVTGSYALRIKVR